MTDSVSVVSQLTHPPDQSTDSYVRTDVRTDGDRWFPPENISPVRYAQEPQHWFTRFDDEAERLTALASRHPVIRTGARTPIPWPMRLAIYLRDGNTCQLCGTWIRYGEPNLDHVIPWSAGGPDASDNLRTLCAPCNQQRSNHDHGATGKRLLPVTWWCLDCWREGGPLDAYGPHGSHAWRYAVAPLTADETSVLAFCATCDANGYTSESATRTGGRLCDHGRDRLTCPDCEDQP